MKNFLLSLLVVSALAVSCKDDDDMNGNVNPNEITTQDRSFATNASTINNTEIQLAKLALTKAQNPAIIDYARMIVGDHTAAKGDLFELTYATGILVSDSLDTAHVAAQMMLYNFTGTDNPIGTDFESAYIHLSLTNQQNALSAFNSEFNGGSYAPLRLYAGSTKSKIEKHVALANSLLKTAF